MSRRKTNQYVITRLRNSCLITFFENTDAAALGVEAVTRGVLLKKVFLKIRKLHRKTPLVESFLIKLQVFSLQVLKKRLQHKYFPVKFAKL